MRCLLVLIFCGLVSGCETRYAVCKISVIEEITIEGRPGIRRGDGTAFAISKHLWLTAAHNLDGAGKLTIGEYAASVVAKDQDLDVAVVRTEQPSDFWLELWRDPDPGEKVVFYGYPKGVGEYAFGTVSARFWKGSACYLLKIDKFDHGCSGSPVYVEKNDICKVVGMAVAGIPDEHGVMRKDQALFVPALALSYFLADRKIHPEQDR